MAIYEEYIVVFENQMKRALGGKNYIHTHTHTCTHVHTHTHTHTHTYDVIVVLIYTSVMDACVCVCVFTSRKTNFLYDTYKHPTMTDGYI